MKRVDGQCSDTGTTKTVTLSHPSGVKRSLQITLSEAPSRPSHRTRGEAITAHCKECICDPAGFGSCTAQITLCTSFDCPLWDYRPVSSAPLSNEAMKGVPEHLLDRDWCADPANFRIRPYVGAEKDRINSIVRKQFNLELTKPRDQS